MKTSGQDILLPEKKRSKVSRSLFFEVHSTDRDRRIFKTSNEFRWRFPVPIKEVTQIRIIGGSIPRPLYNIDSPYNAFTIRVGVTSYNIAIAPGNYTAATLAAAIEAAINAAAAPTVFACTVDPVTGLFGLARTVGALSFTLLFGSGNFVDNIDKQSGGLIEPNSLATILGFPPAQDVANVGGYIESPFAVNLDDRLNRIYLFLNYESTQDLTAIGRGLGRKEPSLIIYMDQGIANMKFLNKETYDLFILSAPAPISRIGTLDVSFRDEYYRPVNFNGREVTLLMEAVVYDQ
jgi:hypothetical protein